ncbi:MAG: sensor histidine kinase [Asticcacaulis sp.]|jgi:light-regulated signal transduction histidine kinase (bacteriophytochrome)|uniref:histidine kinase n=2 Tax=Asticcacaulis TaxID=76890 RepID=A0ABT5IAI4_9CAUL|nr:ATP-binding protein [Asticcacaulis currens]MDC7693184.1 ATP-binding protein [Asticcacaulis currens]
MQKYQIRSMTEMDPAEEFKDFAYIVSHDLAGPVRSLVEFSRLLVEQAPVPETDDARTNLSMVLESGEKLQEILHGLLQFSRLNTVPRLDQKVDLEEIVARVHMNRQTDLDMIRGTLNPGNLPEVSGDPNRLYQLFYMLIDNAIKFRRRNQPLVIDIGCEETEQAYWISITDNGIGIDPMFHDDVFRPLRKLHNDDVYDGAGMGLTLARKIVLMHGGQIGIGSSDDGTAISFSLPKA